MKSEREILAAAATVREAMKHYLPGGSSYGILELEATMLEWAADSVQPQDKDMMRTFEEMLDEVRRGTNFKNN